MNFQTGENRDIFLCIFNSEEFKKIVRKIGWLKVASNNLLDARITVDVKWRVLLLLDVDINLLDVGSI